MVMAKHAPMSAVNRSTCYDETDFHGWLSSCGYLFSNWSPRFFSRNLRTGSMALEGNVGAWRVHVSRNRRSAGWTIKEKTVPKRHFRSTPINGHRQAAWACLKSATTGLMRRSKQHRHSITSSARPSSGSVDLDQCPTLGLRAQVKHRSKSPGVLT
jgi:hypothetical protein